MPEAPATAEPTLEAVSGDAPVADPVAAVVAPPPAPVTQTDSTRAGRRRRRRSQSPSQHETFVRRVRRRYSAATGYSGSNSGSAADEPDAGAEESKRGVAADIGGAIAEGARRVGRTVRRLRPGS
jgi:hypothetical protein